MSRKLTAVFFAMVVLVGAMSLKALVTGRSSGQTMIATNSGPPPTPWK